MKLCNFKVAKDFIALEQEGSYFDLHNCFDFKTFEYDTSKKSLRFHWTKNPGDWVPEDAPKSLELTFSGVYLFKARERNPEIPFTEDDCLSDIGFLRDELLNEMDGLDSNEPDGDRKHLLMHFMSGLSLKIGAEEALLSANGT